MGKQKQLLLVNSLIKIELYNIIQNTFSLKYFAKKNNSLSIAFVCSIRIFPVCLGKLRAEGKSQIRQKIDKYPKNWR